MSECVCQILMLGRLFIHNSRLPQSVRTKQYIFYQEEVKCTAHNPLTVLLTATHDGEHHIRQCKEQSYCLFVRKSILKKFKFFIFFIFSIFLYHFDKLKIKIILKK